MGEKDAEGTLFRRKPHEIPYTPAILHTENPSGAADIPGHSSYPAGSDGAGASLYLVSHHVHPLRTRQGRCLYPAAELAGANVSDL